MGGCRLLYSVKSKNGKNFACCFIVCVFIYVNTFIFCISCMGWQEGGGP